MSKNRRIAVQSLIYLGIFCLLLVAARIGGWAHEKYVQSHTPVPFIASPITYKYLIEFTDVSTLERPVGEDVHVLVIWDALHVKILDIPWPKGLTVVEAIEAWRREGCVK